MSRPSTRTTAAGRHLLSRWHAPKREEVPAVGGGGTTSGLVRQWACRMVVYFVGPGLGTIRTERTTRSPRRRRHDSSDDGILARGSARWKRARERHEDDEGNDNEQGPHGGRCCLGAAAAGAGATERLISRGKRARGSRGGQRLAGNDRGGQRLAGNDGDDRTGRDVFNG
ncbi:hypothetical protein THAOC_24090, partial [Thalassiosira oceanica]